MAALANPLAGTSQVTTDQMAALWRSAAAILDDEFLGMAQRPMPSGSFRIMCYSVIHGGTLRRALPRILDFLGIVLGSLHGVLTIEDGLARISLTDDYMPGNAFAHRMYWILVHGLSCWLIGRRIPLHQVDFGSDLPDSEGDYRLFFGAPVRFEAEQSSLVFDQRFLHLPIQRDETALKLFLQGMPGNILVRYRQDMGSAVQIIQRLLVGAPGEWPNFEYVARQMRISPASLRRRLAREGQSFQQIKDNVRRRIAIEMLSQTSDKVSDIAMHLGFTEPSAFFRAFRRWTGLTPAGYRKTGS